MSESTLETLKQIDKNIDSTLGDIQDISLFVVSNRYVRSYLKIGNDESIVISDAVQNINEDLANLTGSKSYISSINIYGDNGLYFETSGPSRDMTNGVENELEKQLPTDGSYIIRPTYKRYFQSLGQQYVMSFYRQINDINNFKKRLGFVRIDIDEDKLNNIYRSIKLGRTGYIFIVDKGGYIVSHPEKSQIAEYIKDMQYFSNIFNNSEGYYRQYVGDKDMLITYYTSKSQSFIYVSMVPYKELITEIALVRRLTILIIIAVSAVAFIISYIISSSISIPVKKLRELMQKVENGDLNVEININRRDEIGALGKSFNSMTGKLKTLIEEVYENKISRKEAELRALQAQINPHFLYNTLDVIYWTSRMENAPKTGKMVTALAKLFKLGLNKGNEITTIAKEVEHLQNYLILQNVRYDEEPDITIDVSPSLYSCRTIKVILQPLVENALIHGIDELGSKGKICISGCEIDGDILFRVEDNGKGMDEEMIKEIFKGNTKGKKVYGIKNVDERIKLYFGENYGISIYSNKGVGTMVEIRIPKVLGDMEASTVD